MCLRHFVSELCPRIFSELSYRPRIRQHLTNFSCFLLAHPPINTPRGDWTVLTLDFNVKDEHGRDNCFVHEAATRASVRGIIGIDYLDTFARYPTKSRNVT